MIENSLSIIIPCYNESKNLEKLLNNIKNSVEKINFGLEIILVNNGSTDDTLNKLNLLTRDMKEIRILNIKKNIGYGNGILMGLSSAKNNFLGWTHADLQCDFNDCLEGFKILLNQNEKNNSDFLLKGKRVNRKLLDKIFTDLMSIYIKLICKIDLQDINAQPKIFPRKLYDLFENPPKDFLLDFYIMHLSNKNNYKILNKDVYFSNRVYGESKGGGSLIGKIKLSIKTAYYIFKYRDGNYNT